MRVPDAFCRLNCRLLSKMSEEHGPPPGAQGEVLVDITGLGPAVRGRINDPFGSGVLGFLGGHDLILMNSLAYTAKATRRAFSETATHQGVPACMGEAAAMAGLACGAKL